LEVDASTERPEAIFGRIRAALEGMAESGALTRLPAPGALA